MKRSLALVCVLLLALSLCACGSSGKTTAATPQANGYAYDSAASAEMPEPMEEAEAAYAGLADMETGALAAAAGGGADAAMNPEKIIYSSDVTVETTTFDDTVAAIAALMEEYGGWIESSSVNGANYYSRARGYASNRSAHYTLRVPSRSFQQIMSGLSKLGNVPYTHTYTENVTAQYYDVQARLTAYTTQETRLLEMMEQAETVSDVISIEEKLTELRYQIESLQSTLNNYDRRVSYSSIYLSLEEVQEYTPETVVELSYGQQLGRALTNGFKNAGNFFKDLLVFLVGSLPALIFLAVAAVVITAAVKKRRAKKAARRAAPIPQSETPEDL